MQTVTGVQSKRYEDPSNLVSKVQFISLAKKMVLRYKLPIECKVER